MPFDPTAGNTRLTSGVTPYLIHKAMAQKIANARILERSNIWMVLDDEIIPTEQPPSENFITVRYPSLIWTDGDVQGGDNNKNPLSEFRLSGQTRHTLWLLDEVNLTYGTAEGVLDTAFGPAPAGERFLGAMVKCFWEQDLQDEAGNALTNRPFRFVSLEMPEGTSQSLWRPFRLTWEVKFTWDLTKEPT